LPWGTVVTSSNDYVHVYQTTLGCDSTVTAHIIIGTGGRTDTTADRKSVVKGKRNDKSYTATGTDSLFIPNGACTDTVVLHVTIGQPLTSEFTASVCASYTLPWGTVVTSSNDYVHVYQTTLGCDSTVTAHIIIGTGGRTDTT